MSPKMQTLNLMKAAYVTRIPYVHPAVAYGRMYDDLVERGVEQIIVWVGIQPDDVSAHECATFLDKLIEDFKRKMQERVSNS